MIRFKATIKKFAQQGEKTGWTYIEIPEIIAKQLKPDQKTSFRVKGLLDAYEYSQVALLPMGGGDFIMALKSEVMKSIGKRVGHQLEITMEPDASPFVFSEDFIQCLNDEPLAMAFFKSLPMSHQKYFSKWIDGAKTTETKTRRIVIAVEALKRKMGYAEMIRQNKKPISSIF